VFHLVDQQDNLVRVDLCPDEMADCELKAMCSSHSTDPRVSRALIYDGDTGEFVAASPRIDRWPGPGS
jgi:hypothetical protein